MTIFIRESIDNLELLDIKFPNIIKNVIIGIIKKINYIKVINNINNKVFIVPNIKDKKLENKIVKKIKKQKNVRQVVLSKNIKKIVKNTFLIEKIKILDGKSILKYLIEQILIIVENKQKVNLEFEDLYFLANEYNKKNIEVIEYFTRKVKTVNIVTNKVNLFKKLEEEYYKNDMFITISNNKKKSLKRAKIIINIDYNKEEILNYNINRNAIIINLTNNKIDNLKGFDGIIINNVEINNCDIIKEYFYDIDRGLEIFSNIDLYQILINESQSYLSIIDKIKEDKIKVKSLLGNNGIISEKELSLKKKFLTN